MAKDELLFNKYAGAILASLLFVTSTKLIAESIYAPKTTASETTAKTEKTTDEQVDIAALLAKADAKAGAKYASKCKSCHTFDKGGKAKVGPNLYNIVGRKVASSKDFKYSPALAKHGGTWDYDLLNCFLAAPKKCIKGNKMAFGGIKDPQTRANVIDYLRTLSDKPMPLPVAGSKSKKTAAKKSATEAKKPTTKAKQAKAGKASKASQAKFATLLAQANVSSGKRVAKKCTACHTFKKGGKTKTGPNLYGIVGRKIGAVKGYKYSSAMAKHGGVWDYVALDQFLAKPKKFIRGTKMGFAGLKKPQDRADLIAYLRTFSPNPVPLPKS